MRSQAGRDARTVVVIRGCEQDPGEFDQAEDALSTILAEISTQSPSVALADALMPTISIFIGTRRWDLIQPILELYIEAAELDAKFRPILEQVASWLMLEYDGLSTTARMSMLDSLPRMTSSDKVISFICEKICWQDLPYGEGVAILDLFMRVVNYGKLIDAIRSDEDVYSFFQELYERYADECDCEDEVIPGHVHWLRELNEKVHQTE